MNKLLALFSLVLILFSSVLFGQKTNKDTVLFYTLPEGVTISGMRINIPLNEVPFSTSITTREYLDRVTRGFGVEEGFKMVPGLKIDNQANGGRVHLSMRGIGILSERGIRGIRIIQDEIPLNDPAGFAPDMFDVDFANVERTEVFRGQAASLYGGSAAGGIINIITKNPENVPLFGEVTGTTGSNRFWKLNTQFGGKVEKIGYRVTLSRNMGDGYRDRTQFWNNYYSGKIVYNPQDNLSLNILSGYSHTFHQNPEGINLDTYNADPKTPNGDSAPYDERLETERGMGGITGIIKFNSNLQLKFTGYIKQTYFMEANNYWVTRRNLSTPGSSVQLDMKVERPDRVFNQDISVGADFQSQNTKEHASRNRLYPDLLHPFESDTLISKSEIDQSAVGFFAIDRLYLGSRTWFTLSLRYDMINYDINDLLKIDINRSGSKDFSRFTSRAGITYDINPLLTVYGDWGLGFLPPATEDLSYNPKSPAGFNEDLTFATSNGFDAGLRGALLKNLNFDVTAFYMTTDNDFDRFRVPGRGVTTFYRNFGASKRIGGELYVSYYPIEKVHIAFAYTYSNFKYDIDAPMEIMMDNPPAKYIKDGNYLPNSPEHQYALDVVYKPIQFLSLGVSAEGFSKSYIDGANVESEAVEGYTLIGARIGFDLAQFGVNSELSFSARNLGDKKYVAFSEPDPGGNAYQPGAGREFFGTVKIKF